MNIKHRSLTLTLSLGLTAAAAVIGLTGCAGDRYTRSTGEYIDDHSLESRVHHALGENPVLKFNGVTVTAFKGTVQLGGFVFVNEQKNRAGDIAKRVPGVRDVVNNIIVRDENDRRAWNNDRRDYDNNRPYGTNYDRREYYDRRTYATNDAGAVYIDDRTLSARVKSALNHDGEVKLDEVNVNTYNGTVQLSGFVNTAEQKSRAGDIARQVSGVKDVSNNITVKDKL